MILLFYELSGFYWSRNHVHEYIHGIYRLVDQETHPADIVDTHRIECWVFWMRILYYGYEHGYIDRTMGMEGELRRSDSHTSTDAPYHTLPHKKYRKNPMVYPLWRVRSRPFSRDT